MHYCYHVGKDKILSHNQGDIHVDGDIWPESLKMKQSGGLLYDSK